VGREVGGVVMGAADVARSSWMKRASRRMSRCY